MHSTLFTIFGIPIRSYGFMMVVGFALGIWRLVRIAKKQGINPDYMYDLSLISLASGIIGARLLYILLNLSTISFVEFYKVWDGGLSFHGGIVFAIIAVWLYCRFKHLNFLQMADLLSPSLAIGYAFTRIGCFLNGCCYGCPTNLPWGVRFLEDGRMTLSSHPTQIYAFIANIFIFFILTKLENKKLPRGFVFVSYLGLYGIYRFLVEFLRAGYSAQTTAFGLTQAQLASLIMTAVSALILIKLKNIHSSENSRRKM